jgi:predicted ATPase/class 3 adenylate cyclase/tetratricopeptide (TPR) repeat protein
VGGVLPGDQGTGASDRGSDDRPGRQADRTPSLPTGLVTFVMTDIEGSTRLFRQLGDSYLEVLETHRALLGGAFSAHGGIEVDTEGDALFFVFADASEAVAGCLEGQLGLASHPWPSDGEVRVRIGLHTSETTPVGHRYVDLGVHQVARICAGAHGGQVVMSEETVAAVADRLPPASSLLALGAFHLRGFSEPVRLSQLRHPQLRENFPPLRAIGVVVHNLPFLRASFVGRDEEIPALLSLLRTTGILTLVGLGGVGKTRLAVQLAQQVLGDFADGAWLVELASLSDPAFVPRAVADAAHVGEVPGRDIEAVLVEAMADKAALLILDNCEHVIEAVAGVADRLSSHCPQLVILATSREPLDIEGEVVWRVQPLSTVDPRKVSSASDLVAVESVRLFVERARMSSPGFELADENAADVARIVSHLNGIPLAIELAASTLSDQPLSGVLAGLDDRFALLSRGRRTAPERHQTLRAALEWSLDLLEEPERLLFSRLSAFASGVTTEAVVGVCRGFPGTDKDLASGLRRLARASLLNPHPDLPERWSMLESVRELAAIELEAVGATDVVAKRHRDWYASHVEAVEPFLGRTGRADVMRDLAADHDNLRRAMDTAIADHDAVVALRLCTAMSPFWTSHGDWTEGSERLRGALRLEGDDDLIRGRAATALGNLTLLRGDLATAEKLFKEGRERAAAVGDAVALARSLAGDGYVAFRRSQLPEAESVWREALEAAERAGDERVAAGVLRSLAIAAASAGKQGKAGELLDQAIALARRVEDDQLIRLLLGSSAERHLWLGNYRQAEDEYGDALRLATEIGDLSARPLLLAELGWVALLRGDVSRADRLSVEAAELAEDLGNRRVLAHSLRLTGEARMRRGEPDAAETVLDRALAVAQELNAPAEVAGVGCSRACLSLEALDLPEARKRAEDAMALSALPHPMRCVSLGWVLGVVSLMEGELTEAEALFQKDMKTAEEGEMRRHVATSAWGLGCVSAAQEDSVSSLALHQRALAIRKDIEDRLGVIDSLVALAGVIGAEQPDVAAHLTGGATSLRQRSGAVATPREDAEIAQVEASIEAAIGRSAMVRAEEEGARIGEQAALVAALALAPGEGG